MREIIVNSFGKAAGEERVIDAAKKAFETEGLDRINTLLITVYGDIDLVEADEMVDYIRQEIGDDIASFFYAKVDQELEDIVVVHLAGWGE